ncbi:MAG: GtrA family protein [Oscillospiraceae bacterium]
MEKENEKLSKRESNIQALKFLLFSCSAGLIQIGSFTLLSMIIEPYWPSYLISLILSVLFNFTVNRRFTFKSATNVPVAMLKIIAYYCVFTPVTTIAGDYCSKTLEIPDFVVLIVTMILNFVTEFLVCKFFVYRGSINTNDLAKKEKERAEAAAQSTTSVK